MLIKNSRVWKCIIYEEKNRNIIIDDYTNHIIKFRIFDTVKVQDLDKFYIGYYRAISD